MAKYENNTAITYKIFDNRTNAFMTGKIGDKTFFSYKEAKEVYDFWNSTDSPLHGQVELVKITEIKELVGETAND